MAHRLLTNRALLARSLPPPVFDGSQLLLPFFNYFFPFLLSRPPSPFRDRGSASGCIAPRLAVARCTPRPCAASNTSAAASIFFTRGWGLRLYVSLGRKTNVSLSRRGASSSYSIALCLHALNIGLYSLGPCLLSSPGFCASRRLARFHPPRDAGFWHRTLRCCSTLSSRWNGSAVAAVH